MYKVEQEAAQDGAEENSIDLVNINSINFNKSHSVLTANLKPSAGPNNFMVPYKVDIYISMAISCHYTYIKNCYQK